MAGITQRNCVTLFPLWSFKTSDVKQQETCKKFKNRGDDKNTASTATTITIITATTNKSNNNSDNHNNNIIVINKNEKWLYIKKKKYCSPHYFFGKIKCSFTQCL